MSVCPSQKDSHFFKVKETSFTFSGSLGIYKTVRWDPPNGWRPGVLTRRRKRWAGLYSEPASPCRSQRLFPRPESFPPHPTPPHFSWEDTAAPEPGLYLLHILFHGLSDHERSTCSAPGALPDRGYTTACCLPLNVILCIYLLTYLLHFSHSTLFCLFLFLGHKHLEGRDHFLLIFAFVALSRVGAKSRPLRNVC